MNRTSSVGRYTQSFGAKDICILLVNDDYICRNIVADMLDHCRYEAFSYETEMDALNIVREKKDDLELILTNMHRTYPSIYGIIEHIKQEFKLQVIFMSPDIDDIKNGSRSGGNGVTVYIMKSLSVNDMNNLWATALAREKGKKELSSGKLLRVENKSSSVASEACKRTKAIEGNEENGNVEKKPRVVWTKEMHQKFLDAVAQLGHDKAFPKKIVELMNLPGLTRENVASHLQKYRLCMKRAQEGFTGSSYDFIDPFGFNTSSQTSFQLPHHWNPYGTGSRNATTTHMGLNHYGSRLGMPPHFSSLNTIRLKPDHHNFRVYGDEKKSILLSIGNNRASSSNTNFAGFRLSGDGKSVEFGGQNSHLSPEMGNGQNSHLSMPTILTQQPQSSLSSPPWSNWAEPLGFSHQQSSLTSLHGVDQTKTAIMTAPIGTEWDDVVSFTPPQSAGPLWTEPASVSSQPPGASGNDTNANSEIFSDFISCSLPPEFGRLGMVGDDEDGVDATAICIFDDLLQDLT